MTKRSYAEAVCHSHWLARLDKLSEANLIAALVKGDERGDVDASFDLEGISAHDSEYDEGFWHKLDRIDGDVAETRRMLEAPELLVCRLRIAAPPLPIADHPRLVVAHTSSRQRRV
jgi:hypothetical protein